MCWQSHGISLLGSFMIIRVTFLPNRKIVTAGYYFFPLKEHLQEEAMHNVKRSDSST
jgi:hypothetical protein